MQTIFPVPHKWIFDRPSGKLVVACGGCKSIVHDNPFCDQCDAAIEWADNDRIQSIVPFIEQVAQGKKTVGDLSFAVRDWYEHAYIRSLIPQNEYLGFTIEEYKTIVYYPEQIHTIIKNYLVERNHGH